MGKVQRYQVKFFDTRNATIVDTKNGAFVLESPDAEAMNNVATVMNELSSELEELRSRVETIENAIQLYVP